MLYCCSVLFRKKRNTDLLASNLQSLVSELSLEGFVVGYPFDRQRSNPDAIWVKLFVDDLSKTGKLEGLRYTYWDECFTSKVGSFTSLKKHGTVISVNFSLKTCKWVLGDIAALLESSDFILKFSVGTRKNLRGCWYM